MSGLITEAVKIIDSMTGTGSCQTPAYRRTAPHRMNSTPPRQSSQTRRRLQTDHADDDRHYAAPLRRSEHEEVAHHRRNLANPTATIVRRQRC